VQRGGLLVISRNSARREFEMNWGVTLPSNVTFLNANNPSSGVPIINGGEKFAIYHGSTRKDGPSIEGSTGKSFHRVNAANPGSMASWNVLPESGATPGTTELPSGTQGVLVSEWSDSSGTGGYLYEFIEIYVNP